MRLDDVSFLGACGWIEMAGMRRMWLRRSVSRKIMYTIVQVQKRFKSNAPTFQGIASLGSELRNA